MIKKVLVAAAIVIACPAFVFAEDVFFAFGQGADATNAFTTNTATGSSSVFIYSELGFDFDAGEFLFTNSDSSVIEFTGGVGFNPTYDVIGGVRFNGALFEIQSTTAGRFFPINISENGVDTALIQRGFDPGFDPNVGANGAVLLARLDFDIVGEGVVDFDFELGGQGAVDITPDFGTIVLDPTLGSATLTVASVPEPSAAIALILGAFGMVARRKRA